jgi:uncharacterized protein YunC (DUF1805 family)
VPGPISSSDAIPRTVSRELKFANGSATEAGIVGCGIYDLETAAEFSLAIAICKGTPAKPLVEPEDLFESKIVGATPQAEAMGIRKGITGKEAVELMLKSRPSRSI